MMDPKCKKRLEEMCCKIWDRMDRDEKECYALDTGTIGFISDVARILHLMPELLTEEEVEEMLDNIQELDNEI